MTDFPKRRARASLMRLAWRESRGMRRRLLLYMSSISLGVAALVAIDSFAGNVTRSVREQSRALVGGDISFTSRAEFAAPVERMFDSLSRHGVPVARVTTVTSMALAPRTGGTRLVQVRAITPGYPFYGAIETQPAGAWSTVQDGTRAIVDPAVLVALDAKLGDSVQIGNARFLLAGTIDALPGDVGLTSVIGPRVIVSARALPRMGVLTFGSRADREALVKLPEGADAAAFLRPFRTRLDSARVRTRTVAQTERGLTQAVDELRDFLGIVGLIALLLGGVGVASGVNALVARKIDTVAILRCVGATSQQVMAIYVAQSAVMGFAGAAAGALLGIAIQFALPAAISDFLPVDVHVRLEPRALTLGLLTGLWVAVVFALRPLLALRNVSPLQAIRRSLDADVMKRQWTDLARHVVDLGLLGSVLGIAIARTGSTRLGTGISIGIGIALLALWLSATALSTIARHAVRGWWPYVVRQGVANLYRPANQTRAVVLALGFGAFLVTTLYLVQASLLHRFQVTTDSARGNVVFFDVQEDQAKGLDSLIRASGHNVVDRTPIVSMRVGSVNGRTVAAIMADTTRRRGGWALRREFRSTYRDTLVASERLVTGRWFRPATVAATAAATAASSDSTPTWSEVSLDQEIAKELRVRVGDSIVWDVQGVKVPTVLTSLREVDFARFEANFYAVFPPAALASAPKQFVFVANVPSGAPVARLQRDVVTKYANVASVDLSLIRQTVSRIVDRVTLAVRFLAIFSLAMGVPVLFSAVAATRRDRLRESVLLKTLGATRAQIGRILLAEYALLGLLGALTGMVLSFGGAWALAHYMFKTEFTPVPGPAIAIAAGMSALTISIGLLTGRDAFRETPMAALRES